MKKKLAIVGGGYLGYRLARDMENIADVTLIEPGSHFVHSVAMIRALVEPSVLDKALVPYDNLLKKGKWIRARAVAIDEKGVTLDDGTRVDADYIVVATGSDNTVPFKAKGDDIEAFRAAHAKYHAMLAAAKRVAIVGAGAVGVELAGEIAHFMPDKEVTLISDQPALFPGKPARFGKRLLKKLKALGVNVVMGVKAENLESLSEPYAGTLKLSNGQEVQADLVVPAIGSRANPELLQSLPGYTESTARRAKVDQWLRPSTLPNVFAAGDVVDAGDGMTTVATYRQGPWLVKTLTALIKGKKLEELKPYTPWGDAPILVPLGPEKGNTYLMKLVLGDKPTRQMKGKDLFLSRYAKDFRVG